LIISFARDVAREGALDHLLLAEAADHAIERGGEDAELVVGADGDLHREVAGSDQVGGLHETEDRARQHGGQGDRAGHAEHDHEGRHVDRLPPRLGHRVGDGELAEADVERADRRLAEGERRGEVDDLGLAVVRAVRLDHCAIGGDGERGGPREALADHRHVRVRAHDAVLVGEDHVGDVLVLHRLLDEDVQRQVVVGDERALGAAGEIGGDGEATLGHGVGESLRLLAQERSADEQDCQDHETGDEQAQLDFEWQPELHRYSSHRKSAYRPRPALVNFLRQRRTSLVTAPWRALSQSE
jgi:hypothetical protein